MSDIGPSRRPLEDVRVLAVEQYGAGPWGTLQLVELGAEVIKIEDARVGGDVGRYVPPYQEAESSLFFESFNGGKRSIELDLKSNAGRGVFERLVECSDAVFSNLRGTVPAQLRIRYDDLATVNPRIVCCSLSGYGMDGPRAGAGALDFVIQGLTGWMTLTGEPDMGPSRAGLSLVDFTGGYVAALAMLGGIWRARRDGVGCDCDISLHETALSLLTYIGTWSASRGYVPERRPNSAHLSIVPFQNFPTADGWIVVACPKQKLWESFCHAIGRGELLDDPAYASVTLRDENRESLLATLYETLATRSASEWLEILARADVPSGPINDVGTALQDEQVGARRAIEEYEHALLGTVRRVRSPLRLSGPRPDAERAPYRGEHTRETLARLCEIGPEEFEELDRAGAFGS